MGADAGRTVLGAIAASGIGAFYRSCRVNGRHEARRSTPHNNLGELTSAGARLNIPGTKLTISKRMAANT